MTTWSSNSSWRILLASRILRVSLRSASEGDGSPARMVVDHDESTRAEGDNRFKDFPRVSQSFVERSLADRNHLDEFLLGVEQDHSERFVRKKTHFGAKIRYR